MNRLKPTCLIPPELVIKDCDELLYEIGLCLTSLRERPKRWPINNPVFIAIITSIYLSERVASILVPESDRQMLLLVGETGRYFDIKVQWNLILMLTSMIGLSSQTLYYYNHRKGIKPTFLRVFQVMSGSVAPLSVGLNDRRDVRELLKFKPVFKIMLIHYRVVSYVMPFGFIMISFIINEDLSTAVIYGLPNAIWMGIWISPIVAFLFSQFLYFYLICKYLKMKINNLNKIVIESKKSNNYTAILRTIRQYYSIYAEIDEYDTTYWSKFLFFIWLFMGLFVTAFLYVVIFRELVIIIKVMFSYADLIAFGIIHFMFITAAALNSSVHRPYKLLNNIVAKDPTKLAFIRIARLRQKIKVINIQIELSITTVKPNIWFIFYTFRRFRYSLRDWRRKTLVFPIGFYSSSLTSDIMRYSYI